MIKRFIAVIAAIDILLILFFAPSIFINLFQSVFGDALYGIVVVGTIALVVIIVLFARAVGGE